MAGAHLRVCRTETAKQPNVVFISSETCSERRLSKLDGRGWSFPSSFSLAPVAVEVSENPDAYQERLEGWALSQAFVIVRRSGSMKQGRPRIKSCCTHYGDDTLNTHKLNRHAEENMRDKLLVVINKGLLKSTLTVTLPSASSTLSRSGSLNLVYGLVLGVFSYTHSHATTINLARYKKEHYTVLLAFR
jgi:hypothetical protein